WCSDHQFSETQYADFPSQHRRLKCNEVPYAAAGMLDVTWGKDGYDIRRLYGVVHSRSSNERVHRGHWHTYSPADQINIPPTIEKNTVPFTWSSSTVPEIVDYLVECYPDSPKVKEMCLSFNGGPELPLRVIRQKVEMTDASDQRITALEKRVAELEQREHVRNSPTRGQRGWTNCRNVVGDPQDILTCDSGPSPCENGRHLHADNTCHDNLTDAEVKP